MWKLEYKKEVRNYIYDSYPYTEPVWKAIKTLLPTEDALPENNFREIEDGLILWETLEHIVIYERIFEQRKLVVLVLKPTV